MSSDQRPPLPGQIMQTVAELDSYDSQSGRYDTADVEAAQVTTSLVHDASFAKAVNPKRRLDGFTKEYHPLHKVVLDIDLPAQLIPSSTEGHFHLYIDHAIPGPLYEELLSVMGRCGLLEPGYVSACLDRGYTAVRLPWVKKPVPLPADLQAALDEAQVPGVPF